MALLSFEIAEAEQRRRARWHSRWLRNPCRRALGKLKRARGSSDMGDQLVENPVFQGLGLSDDGLLFAHRSAWSILSEEMAGMQNQDAQQGEASS